MIQRRESKNRKCSWPQERVLTKQELHSPALCLFLGLHCSHLCFFPPTCFILFFSATSPSLFHLHMGRGMVPPLNSSQLSCSQKAWPESWCYNSNPLGENLIGWAWAMCSILVQSAVPGVKWSKWSPQQGWTKQLTRREEGGDGGKVINITGICSLFQYPADLPSQCRMLFAFFKKSLSSLHLGLISSGFWNTFQKQLSFKVFPRQKSKIVRRWYYSVILLASSRVGRHMCFWRSTVSLTPVAVLGS